MADHDPAAAHLASLALTGSLIQILNEKGILSAADAQSVLTRAKANTQGNPQLATGVAAVLDELFRVNPPRA